MSGLSFQAWSPLKTGGPFVGLDNYAEMLLDDERSFLAGAAQYP